MPKMGRKTLYSKIVIDILNSRLSGERSNAEIRINAFVLNYISNKNVCTLCVHVCSRNEKLMI